MKKMLIVMLLTFNSIHFAIRAIAASDAPEFAFCVISDIHVQGWSPASQYKLKAGLQDLYKAQPRYDALIVNGDLGDGFPSDYESIKGIINTSPHPQHTYFTIGNHEFYKAWYDDNGRWSPATFPNGETERDSIERFKSFSGEKEIYYHKWVNGYHFLFLGMELYRQSNPAIGEDAFLSDQQLSWLEEKLQENNKSKRPIFVFLHQPLPYTVAGSNVKSGKECCAARQQRLKRLLSAYPNTFFFTGHTHWELKSAHTLVTDRFTMVNSSSVSQPWKPGDMPAETGNSEGLCIEVYKDKLKIKGRDLAHHQWIPQAQYSFPF